MNMMESIKQFKDKGYDETVKESFLSSCTRLDKNAKVNIDTIDNLSRIEIDFNGRLYTTTYMDDTILWYTVLIFIDSFTSSPEETEKLFISAKFQGMNLFESIVTAINSLYYEVEKELK